MNYIKQKDNDQYIPVHEIGGEIMIGMHTDQQPEGKQIGWFWFTTDPFGLVVKLFKQEVDNGRSNQGCNCND